MPYVAAQLGHSVEMLSTRYAGVLQGLEGGQQQDAAEAIRAAREGVASDSSVRLVCAGDAREDQ